MKKRILFYSSVCSLELFKTQKFYQIDIALLGDLGYDVSLSNRILDSLLFWKYDILFSYFYRYSFFAALFAKCLGKKTYFTGGIDSLDADYVSTRSYRIQVLFFKLCYWISNSCIVVSQSDLKNIVKCLSSRKKLSYSEHAIDTRLFISDIPKENLFTSIVWMGNEGNVRRKGVDKALQVFAELKKIPAFADYRFIIIGRKGEGVAFIQSIINKYGLNDSIELIGEVSEEEKIAFLKRSKYYFQLSLYEGFGLAALEALCASNILIHSGKGGLANPIYKEQLVFNIDNDFDSEFSQLISKLTSFVPITSNDELLDYYNIQRRKEDFKAIITDNKSNYKIELI